MRKEDKLNAWTVETSFCVSNAQMLSIHWEFLCLIGKRKL
jgi:hypothetical protein